MPAPPRRQPLDFRQREVDYIMKRWKAPYSVSLVGIGSVGKTNLIQHIVHPEVQQHYIDSFDPRRFKAILIDPNLLGPLPPVKPETEAFRCWAAYELMMNRLYMAFYPQLIEILGADDAKRFRDTYMQLQDGSNPLYDYMGLRYFELGLEFFMQREIKIIFMFDEFEDMLQWLPVKFFQTLRGIRDANKTCLSYMTFSRSPLNALVERYEIPMLKIEPFIELFTDYTLYVGPYSEIDAQRMVNQLMHRSEKLYSEEILQFLMETTGRFAGLLRAGFPLLDSLGTRTVPPNMFDEYTRMLAYKPQIRAECRTIWTSLNRSEQDVLKAVARLVPYRTTQESEDAVNMLVHKKLLLVDRVQNTLEIEPPLFREFVASNPDVGDI